MDNGKIEIIDTSNITEKTEAEGNLWENRRKINRRYEGGIEITIFVQAYNRLEKKKGCIASILKYTSEHKFKLLLVDNGSDDGTFEYFKELEYSPKKILRLTENKGENLATDIGFRKCDTKYIVPVTNDAVVTQGWLDNLLKCAESDERIGQVNPIVTNSSNIKDMPCNKEHTKVLGIDTRCGQPILDIKNRFRREGIELKEQDLFAYTQEPKYYDILRTITPNVVCDKKVESLSAYYKRE